MNKKDVKNILLAGAGLSVGSTLVGKLGGNDQVTNTLQKGMGVASLALPVMGAKMVIDSTDSLYPKSKKKNPYL